MSQRHIRVTVTLNRLDPGDESVFLKEWVHEDGYSSDELGVGLSWGGWEEIFAPWSSVLRVDREPCDCSECLGDLEPALDALGNRRAPA